MRVLIIGGTGNISTAISRHLAALGIDLSLVKRSPEPPADAPGAKVIACDRTDRLAFRSALAGEDRFDCVVDMICYEPEDAACAAEVFRGRTAQFVFCSTVDVYTKTPAVYPVTEENGKIGALPSFPYAWKKARCEQLLGDAARRGDFALTILRPAFTYNDTWSPGIHSFGGQTYHLDRIRKGKPIILHGDGNSIWSATHRDDVARAFVAAIGNPRAHGEDFNVMGEEWMTHNHIWRTIARIMDAPEPDFVYIPADQLGRMAPKEAEWCVENFQYNNLFSNAKAARELGFRYTIPFETGARLCIERLTRDGRIESCDRHPFYDRIVEVWRKYASAMAEAYGDR